MIPPWRPVEGSSLQNKIFNTEATEVSRSFTEGQPAQARYHVAMSARAVILALLLALLSSASYTQTLAQRLILKDGSYQLISKYEIRGDRVHYLSAERNEWEDLPSSLVDWDATKAYARDRAAGKPSAEAIAIDKEAVAERAAEEAAQTAKEPEVAPGLRLPIDGLAYMLDNFHTQPELVELLQNTGDVNRNRTGNILRSTVAPFSGSKQSIELPGAHATIQAHTNRPTIYLQNSVSSSNPGSSENKPAQPEQPLSPIAGSDRFHIVRVSSKSDKRVVGQIKVNALGKAKQQEDLVPTASDDLTGGWLRLTPVEPLSPGEYAVVEVDSKEGMNLYVYDFGVNPGAPQNAAVIKPKP